MSIFRKKYKKGEKPTNLFDKSVMKVSKEDTEIYEDDNIRVVTTNKEGYERLKNEMPHHDSGTKKVNGIKKFFLKQIR